MPLNLVDLAMRFLPTDVTAKIAASLHCDPAAVTKAIDIMVPGAFTGIGTLAAKSDGAHQVADVLSDHDLSELGELTGKIGEPGQDDAIATGARLSRHLMNAADRDKVIAATSAGSGLDATQAERLLSMLAPIVAGTLVQQRLEKDLDTYGLARLLSIDTAAPVSSPLDAVPPVSSPSVSVAPVPTLHTPLPPGELTAAIVDLKPVAEKAPPITPIVPNPVASPKPTRAIPEVAKTPERPVPPIKPRTPPEEAAPIARVTTIRRADNDREDVVRSPAPYRMPTTSLTKIPAEDSDVETAPVRRSGHYLARFGWLLPLILLMLAGSWWLKTLFDEPVSVAVAEPPPTLASNPDPVKPISPIPEIVASTERPPAPAETPPPPKTESAPAPDRSQNEASTTPSQATNVPSPAVTAASVPPPVTVAPQPDAEATRKAAEAAAALAAADKLAREAELVRKAAAEAAAAKRAQDAELARRAAADAEAEARRQTLAREAEIKAAAQRAAAEAEAANARRLAANARPTPTSPATVSLAVCQKTVAELSAANRIRFEFASPRITQASAPALSALVAAIKACPPARIRVEGHTDTDGHFDRNQRLSESRARAVVSYFIKAGVDPKNITFAGYGQTRPRVSNNSEANKQLNRRIEVSVEAG